MQYLLIIIGTLAVTFALAMLWTKGKEQKDQSLKIIAIVAAIAFIVLAFVLTGRAFADE